MTLILKKYIFPTSHSSYVVCSKLSSVIYVAPVSAIIKSLFCYPPLHPTTVQRIVWSKDFTILELCRRHGDIKYQVHR